MTVLKRKQLQGKTAFYLGEQGQFAVKDTRWYYTLDNESFVGPYKRRILAQRAWAAHKEIHIG